MLIPVTEQFSFRRTVLSHGWSALAPFALDTEKWTLHRGSLRITEAPGGVEVTGSRRKSDTATVEHCLRLDEDLSGFYDLCEAERPRGRPDLTWVPGAGAGRMLRCPTVFEDLVKLVTTTNCSWALTERMCHGLVDVLGAGAFPDASTIADAGADTLRELSFGYRAGSVVEIARRVAGGELDPQRWLDPAYDADTLRLEVLALPGCGPYVAENLGRLCGHYDGLALDSWVRAKLARLLGRNLDDRAIARRYTHFGPWRGLALWCEVTADWINGSSDKVAW